MWPNFYLICFVIGFGLSLLSFLLGSFHGHLPSLSFHGDVPDFHAHGSLHLSTDHAGGADAHNGEISWFNFGTATAFLAWFGGTGYLLSRYSALMVWTIFLISGALGVLGAWMLFWFVAKVMLPHDRPLDPRDYEMVGVLGTVTVPVRLGGTGEIVFSQEGVRRCSGARSEDGSAIPKRTEVVVTRYEKGIAYVRRWEDLANEGQQ